MVAPADGGTAAMGVRTVVHGGGLRSGMIASEGSIDATCQSARTDPFKVSLGFVESFNNKIRVIQRRAYGLRDEEYPRLKILTCMLPEI